MKKLLIMALLVLALVVTAVACDGHGYQLLLVLRCFTIPVPSALPTPLKDGFSKHLLGYALSRPLLLGTG